MSASNGTGKTVVLADPRWNGHHPTYFVEFTASLLRLGHRVIGLCRKPGELRELASDVCEELGLVFDEVLHVGRLDDPDRAYLRPGHDHDPVSAVVRWRCLRKAIDRAEEASGWGTQFVFLPWLDSYLRFQPSKLLPSMILGHPWSGLYFRNHHFSKETRGWLVRVAKGDGSLRNARCRTVGVLDERFEQEMVRETGKEVIVFPDITDETDPPEPSPFAAGIVRKAKGRKIIGMVSLEKRKGFLTMLRIAEAVAGREDWYFVAAGTYAAATCSEEEQRYVQGLARRIGKGELDHIHLELPGERIADGADFNSLIKAFDVIYAAYEEFEGSSNALTKGAVFERPLVATRGECVGGRVEEFGLGLTIEQGSVKEGEEAIRRILRGVDWEDQPLAFRFADYHRRHDRNRLDEVFREILAKG